MRRSLAGPLGLVAFAVSLSLPAADLTEVVITANRVPQAADAPLAATTVLTRADIESRQARSVEDLLQGVEGLAIGNSGGPGKLTSFFVRGTESDHLLVVVDGVRIGSVTAGMTALQNIPVELIERIELVRGPRSSLYGADAIGGVLQIFTRRGGGALRPEVSVSGGSFQTRQASASLGGGSERAWVQAQVAWQETDGIDACYGRTTPFAGCGTEEPDRDGYRYRSVALRAGGQLSSATDIDASLLRAASRVEFDGSFQNRSRMLQQVAGLGLTHRLGAGGSIALRAGRAWDRADNFHETTPTGDFDTRRDSLSLQWDLSPAAGQLLSVGLDYLDDHVSSSTTYDETSRDNKALFAQYVGDRGPWRTELSLRGDDNEQFGSHVTGSAAVGYALRDDLQVLAQYGTAFKAPTFNDLYWPGFSNPDLDPERSRSFEVALRGQGNAASWRLSVFDTRVRDLIAYGMAGLENVETARIRGVEASARVLWGAWRFDGGASLQDAKDRSGGFSDGNRLVRRPRLSGHLDVAHYWGAVSVGARLVSAGHAYDNQSNTSRLGGYGVLDLRAETTVADDWRLQLRAANVFDKQYETVAFYNQPGRALYLTLRYAPGR